VIYEVTLAATYFDQQIINRWNYLSSGAAVGITGAAALAAALGFVVSGADFVTGSLARAMQLLQSTSLLYNSVLVKAIREAPTDFYDFSMPTGIGGANGGSNAMSPTSAYGFYTNRVRTDIARGTKRFAGVTEVDAGAGGAFVEGTIAAMTDLAELMSTSLPYTDGGSSLNFAPIVVQKLMYTTPPAKKAYRYYDTISEQLDHIAEGIVWTPYPQVRTQVSRQYGHGA